MILYTLYISSQNFWEEFLQFLPNFWEEFLPKIFGMSFWEENGGSGNHDVYVGTNLSSCQFRNPQSKAEGYYYLFSVFMGNQ